MDCRREFHTDQCFKGSDADESPGNRLRVAHTIIDEVVIGELRELGLPVCEIDTSLATRLVSRCVGLLSFEGGEKAVVGREGESLIIGFASPIESSPLSRPLTDEEKTHMHLGRNELQYVEPHKFRLLSLPSARCFIHHILREFFGSYAPHPQFTNEIALRSGLAHERVYPPL